ncbi:MAG: ATP-binding cassette domain-containing protein [Opitutales bacterium]
MLSCEQLSVRADRSDFKILEDVNAAFPEKSLNALVGPSGCGKTTLIKAFLGLMDSEGEISVEGQGNLGFVPPVRQDKPNRSNIMKR